jgi:hypothetical protein
MLNETFIRKLNKIISEYASQPDDLVEQIVYLTNDLKNDIAEAIKDKAQSGGGVDFIDVPQAIEIVAKGGTVTKKEWLELARDYMTDGEVDKAKEILDGIIGE